jgi:hypothetical protein
MLRQRLLLLLLLLLVVLVLVADIVIKWRPGLGGLNLHFLLMW